MIKNFRYELSFKNIDQLEKKLNFCKQNGIYSINIPCKGDIKKEFLLEIVDYLGIYYKNFDIVFHYSFYHQYSKNRNNSIELFLQFIEKSSYYKNNNILLVSGSKIRKSFELIDVMYELRNEISGKNQFGVAFNPYFLNNEELNTEKKRFIEKLNLNIINSVWLQFGSDIRSLSIQYNFLTEQINKIILNNNQQFKIYGSLFMPSKQLLARFKFRPWRGVYLSNDYLNSLEEAKKLTKDILRFYVNNNITPLVESDCSSMNQLQEIYYLADIN